MAEDNKIKFAHRVFNILCSAIERRNWHYDRDDEKMQVYFIVSGDDIPMEFIALVEPEMQIVCLQSLLPFTISKEKRIQAAVAVCAVSYGLTEGNFDYNLKDGTIYFRITASYAGCIVGEGLFQHLISYSCDVVDEYNDKFMALEKGYIDIDDFISDN